MRVWVALAVLAVASPAAATTARELLAQSEAKNGLATWKDRQAKMRVRSFGPDQAVRVLSIDLLEGTPEGGHSTRMVYREPADSSGTIFLRTTPEGGEAEEWLWVPQARRARRLPKAFADASALAPDLSYRDFEQVTRLLRWDDQRASASIVSEEPLEGGGTATIIEVVPRSGSDAYARHRLWLEAGSLRVTRVDMYDAEGAVRRRVHLRDYRTDGGHATPTEIEIERLPGSDRSAIRLEDLRYDAGVPAQAFSLNRLMRGE
jgi:hypothetical protein